MKTVKGHKMLFEVFSGKEVLEGFVTWEKQSKKGSADRLIEEGVPLGCSLKYKFEASIRLGAFTNYVGGRVETSIVVYNKGNPGEKNYLRAWGQYSDFQRYVTCGYSLRLIAASEISFLKFKIPIKFPSTNPKLYKKYITQNQRDETSQQPLPNCVSQFTSN